MSKPEMTSKWIWKCVAWHFRQMFKGFFGAVLYILVALSIAAVCLVLNLEQPDFLFQSWFSVPAVLLLLFMWEKS